MSSSMMSRVRSPGWIASRSSSKAWWVSKSDSSEARGERLEARGDVGDVGEGDDVGDVGEEDDVGEEETSPPAPPAPPASPALPAPCG